MSLTHEPQFGPYVYRTADAEINSWRDRPVVRGAVSPAARSDISRAVDGNLAPRVITLEGTIGNETWTSRDDLQAAIDALSWAHRPGYRQLYQYSERYLTAEARGITFAPDPGLLWLDYTIEFEAPDPFWYAANGDTDTWNAPANGGTRSPSNGGVATARPVFTVTVSATGTLGLTLTNTSLAANNAFTITGLAVTNGQALVIDCAEQTVKLAGTNKTSAFSGSFFLLDPGTNNLELTLSGVTLTSIVTTWRKRWL